MKKQKKRDSLESAIRAAVRVQEQFKKEGIGLHFTMTFGPVPPPDPKTLRRV